MAKILLAEDSERIRVPIVQALEMDGHVMTAVGNGQAALEMIEAGGFDLIIMDIWMPGLDGLSVLAALRANGIETPVIVISGGGPNAPLEVSALLAQTHGATCVLVKPFEIAELTAAIDLALG